ncbi:hypothetical protein [Galbibacter orientalis]|uniref:hypothetical protein n=1 Tax=Galbibacter orientalis TaxID=453852 RepID=UPI003080E03A
MELIKTLMSKNGINSKKENADMFYSYYIFGKSIDKPIWDWNNWKQVTELLHPIIDFFIFGLIRFKSYFSI